MARDTARLRVLRSIRNGSRTSFECSIDTGISRNNAWRELKALETQGEIVALGFWKSQGAGRPAVFYVPKQIGPPPV